MTRPGGVTPRGLPYPGSANIQAETPKALQSLAEAVSGQLSSVGGGIVFDYFVGTKALDGNSTASIAFPRLASVQGMLVSYGNWLGGPMRAGNATGGGSQFTVNAANAAIYGGVETFANTTVSVCAVAWGPPV